MRIREQPVAAGLAVRQTAWMEPHDSFHCWAWVMVLQFLAYVRECDVNDQP